MTERSLKLPIFASFTLLDIFKTEPPIVLYRFRIKLRTFKINPTRFSKTNEQSGSFGLKSAHFAFQSIQFIAKMVHVIKEMRTQHESHAFTEQDKEYGVRAQP